MKITTPKKAFRFFKTRLATQVEEFWVAALNSNKEVTAATCLFRGTVNECPFHPRDVFRFAVLNNAVSLMVAHNHPSGDVRPSDSDIEVTLRLIESARILKIPVDDHLIISKGSRFYSFLENGWMRESDGRPNGH